ncbi:MAG: cyclodeaminase/cyclohydrolase family protein [Candidatus Omnitrophota bacterium]
MKKYFNYSLRQYADAISLRTPVPGGGSAAALTGCLGAALISMVAQYSQGKSPSPVTEKKIKRLLAKNERIRRRLLELVDEDAQAYLQVTKARRGKKSSLKSALAQARKVPLEVCQLCYSALQLTPFLVKNGNQNLMSDIQVAINLLLAAFQSSLIHVQINQ